MCVCVWNIFSPGAPRLWLEICFIRLSAHIHTSVLLINGLPVSILKGLSFDFINCLLVYFINMSLSHKNIFVCMCVYVEHFFSRSCVLVKFQPTITKTDVLY